MTRIIDNRNRIFKEKEKLILISVSLLMFCIHIIHISRLGILFVLDDEFGYWSNAAYLAGYDWSSAASNIAYYSYGYSILLVPLFWIFENPIHMYRAAIVLNATMMCGSFFICYDMAKKLAKDTNSYLLMAISFVISMYPAYIVQANVAWSEIALIFVCWFISWCFLNINNQTSLIKFVVLGFLCVYVYVIHQRAIGILTASFIVISLMKHFKKINWMQFVTFMLSLIILLFIHKLLKSDIQANNYLSSSMINKNDFVGQIDKIKAIFTFDGFQSFINIFIGQFFYVGAASLLLSYIGVYEMLSYFKNIWISIQKEKHCEIINRNEKFYLYIFLGLAFFSTVIISVLFMSNPVRIDHIIYGRYTEMILGPIMLLGFINLSGKNKINLYGYIAIIMCFLFITITTNFILKSYGFTEYNRICVTGILFKPYLENDYNVFISALIAILIFSFMYISFTAFKKNKHLLLLVMLCMAVMFFVTGEAFVVLSMGGDGDYSIIRNFQNLKISDYIKENNYELPVYFLLSNDFNSDRPKDFYQFLLKDKSIICVTKEQLDLVKDDKYVIIGSYNNYVLELYEEYDYCLNAADSYLFVSKAGKNDIE